MKKTYLWRILLGLIEIIILGISYIINNQLQFDICENVYSTATYQGCLDQGRDIFGIPLMYLSLSLLSVSPFLFFVRDEVFLKWLRFAAVWFGIAIVLIAVTPEYHAGIFSMMNPTKESVSVLFASLFIPTSLFKLLVDSKRKNV